MEIDIINSYITIRYDRWLDYSKYHCSLACIPDEAVDVLNEVLAMLLEKETAYLLRLYESRKGDYRELDFYVLQMIKLNITSDTSPYRHKYKPIPVDENVNWQLLDIEDETDQERDKADTTLREMRLIRYIFERLELTELERQVFAFRFFAGESFSKWPGPENDKALYQAYKIVYSAIAKLLYSLRLIRKVTEIKVVSRRSKERIQEICETFMETRQFVLINEQE